MSKKSHDEQTKKKISKSLKQTYEKNPNSRSKAVEHIPSGNQYPSGKEAAEAHSVSVGTVNNHCQLRVKNPEFRYVNFKPVKYFIDGKGNRYRTLQEAADANGCAVSTVKYHIDGNPKVRDRKFMIEYEFVKK